MKSSIGGSSRRPCSPARKPPRCCSGRCWLKVRSTCAKSRAGKVSTKGPPIRRLTSPHHLVTSSCGRSRQTQFQHKSRRDLPRLGSLMATIGFRSFRQAFWGQPALPLADPSLIVVSFRGAGAGTHRQA
jgi:hypothetical protein